MFPSKFVSFRNFIAAAVLPMLLVAIVVVIPASRTAEQFTLQPVPASIAEMDAPATPIHAVLTIDTYPLPGQPARLVCELTTILDAPGTHAQFELPPDARLLGGKLTWQGDLVAGAPVRLEATVAFDTNGAKSVFCRALRVVDENETWGDLAELYFHVAPPSSGPGFAAAQLEQRVIDGVMVRPGDGQPVKGAPAETTGLSSAPVEPPPSADPIDPEAQPAFGQIEPAAEGDLTVTGTWSFYGRADEILSEQMLVEIVRGDNNNHLAWCYTDPAGYYSCGPFTNPGAVGVRSYFRPYMKFNPYGDILVSVNPDWGTSNSWQNTIIVQSPAHVFADGTGSIGGQFVPHGNTWERAFWITRDLIRTWKYIYFGTGASHSPIETTGGATVEWKPDSTEGDYTTRGGNIYLTGTAPLSNSVVIHEYGHAIMWTIYGAWMPTSDCPSPHYVNRISGTVCGWIEGWADFLTLAVNNDPIYRWDDGGAVNMETPTWGAVDWQDGDRVEGRVAGALWDILDANNDGDDIYSDGGITNIWHAVYNQNDSRFSEFWSAWRGYGFNNSSFGPIMGMYQNTINYRLGPGNDDFSGAVTLGIATRATEPTINATTQGIDPATTCGSTTYPRQSRSVWFRYIPSTNLNVEINAQASGYVPVVALWTGTAGALTSRGCGNNTPLVAAVTSGTTYYIEIMQYGNGSGGNMSMNLCISPESPALTGPADGARTADHSLTLSWGAVPNANIYNVQVALDPGFTNLIGNEETPGLSVTHGSLPYRTYYWRVRSKYQNSICGTYGSWSTPRSYTFTGQVWLPVIMK